MFHIIHQAGGETIVGLLGARGLGPVQVQGLRHLEGSLHILVQPQLDLGGCLQVGCPRNKQKNSGSNRKKTKQDLFRLCLGLFRETEYKKCRFLSAFQTFIEITETNRTLSKQTETTLNFLKITKYALYQTVSVGLLFVSVQSKHRNSLFRYIEAKQPK